MSAQIKFSAQEQRLADAYNLKGWRVVKMQIDDRTRYFVAPDDGRPLEDLLLGELRRCPWMEAVAEMRDLGLT